MTTSTRRAWVLGLASLGGFAVVLLLLLFQHDALQRFDTWVGTPFEELTFSVQWLYSAAIAVQWLFDTGPMTVLTIITAIALFVKGHKRLAVWTAVVMTVSAVAVNAVIKPLIGRERPTWPHPVETLDSLSFPSGHAAGIATAAAVAYVISQMLIRRRGLRRVALVVSLIVVFLVGIDRMLLGVHNFSDVLAGWLIGFGVAAVGRALFDPHEVPLAHKVEAMPSVGPKPKHLAVVLNPIKVDDPGAFKYLVESLAHSAGWQRVDWYYTTIEDPGHSMAHSAAVSGAELVIACGGDGTVRTVCEELAGTGIPVGIVPAGTGNLLARNLNLPLYLRAAVDVALNGQDRAIDMVKVSGDKMDDATFLVMAGMGFDAAIMDGVNEDLKAKVGWVAYVLSGLRSLMFPAIRVDISVDGGDFTTHRARTIVIGNVGYLQAGMPLIPDSRIDDGELDVVLLYPRRFLSWVPLALRVLSKNKRTDETITRMSGKSVTVRAHSETPRQLDGDLIKSGHEIHAECIHGRLLVRAPR